MAPVRETFEGGGPGIGGFVPLSHPLGLPSSDHMVLIAARLRGHREEEP